MNPLIARRTFLKQSAVFAAGVALAPSLRAGTSPNEKVGIAIIGCNGRGMNHITALLDVPNAEIVCICDVDSRAMQRGIAAVAAKQARKPRGVADIRRVLEDKDVDAISIAMPDHWHAPATIMACAAGKHVYVEKPGSHNLREGELMVAAARKHKRVVQMGNQRRSWPWVIEAIAALHAGEIGKVLVARGWYANRRDTIGRGKAVAAPEWLDYSLWQGPAPERPFHDNILHYHWHWFWRWGTGEMGNNGVHALDLARWGLQVELPTRVTCGGGRYFFEDDQETPDTINATFDFGGKAITWEGRSCAPRGYEESGFGVTFFGEHGSVVTTNTGAKIFDAKDKLVREINSGQAALYQYDAAHFGNFIDGVREGKALRTEIAEGQKSTTLCHLANIAWRTGRTVNFDPQSRKILGDRKAAALAAREYRRGWEPKV